MLRMRKFAALGLLLAGLAATAMPASACCELPATRADCCPPGTHEQRAPAPGPCSGAASCCAPLASARVTPAVARLAADLPDERLAAVPAKPGMPALAERRYRVRAHWRPPADHRPSRSSLYLTSGRLRL